MSSFVQIALAANADNAKRVLHTFTCESSLALRDPVYFDATTPNKVLKPSDNVTSGIIVGFVYQKPSDTTARVIIVGVLDGFSGLTQGSRVFLSATGGVTQTRPVSGITQCIGVACSSTEILVVPNTTRVLTP